MTWMRWISRIIRHIEEPGDQEKRERPISPKTTARSYVIDIMIVELSEALTKFFGVYPCMQVSSDNVLHIFISDIRAT